MKTIEVRRKSVREGNNNALDDAKKFACFRGGSKANSAWECTWRKG
jgi:hypothetical protein